MDPKALIQTSFMLLLIVFLLAVLIQQIAPELVDRYISLDYFLIVIIVLGALVVVTKRGHILSPEEETRKEIGTEIIKSAEAYCIKCKAKRAMKSVQDVTMKNGKRAKKGVCTICGSGMYKMGG